MLLFSNHKFIAGHEDYAGKDPDPDKTIDSENPEIVSGLSPDEEKDKLLELVKKIR